MKTFYCNYLDCENREEPLKWPEEYKKGDKPINAETNQPHFHSKKKQIIEQFITERKLLNVVNVGQSLTSSKKKEKKLNAKNVSLKVF
mgnify:CR=1 FL=1